MRVAISFLIFCITCVASTYGAYWFIFQSPVSLRTELTVSRGTVTVILADGTKDYITGSTVFVDGGLLWAYEEQ